MDTIGPPKIELRGKALIAAKFVECIGACPEHLDILQRLIDEALKVHPIPDDLEEQSDNFDELTDRILGFETPESTILWECEDCVQRRELAADRSPILMLAKEAMLGERNTAVEAILTTTDVKLWTVLAKKAGLPKLSQTGQQLLQRDLDRIAAKHLKEEKLGDKVSGGPIFDIPEEE